MSVVDGTMSTSIRQGVGTMTAVAAAPSRSPPPDPRSPPLADGADTVLPAPLGSALEALHAALDTLLSADPDHLPGRGAGQIAAALHAVAERATAGVTGLLPRIDRDGRWALDGDATYVRRVARHLGLSVGAAASASPAPCNDHLPGTLDAARSGQVGSEAAAVLGRAVSSDARRAATGRPGARLHRGVPARPGARSRASPPWGWRAWTEPGTSPTGAAPCRGAERLSRRCRSRRDRPSHHRPGPPGPPSPLRSWTWSPTSSSRSWCVPVTNPIPSPSVTPAPSSSSALSTATSATHHGVGPRTGGGATGSHWAGPVGGTGPAEGCAPDGCVAPRRGAAPDCCSPAMGRGAAAADADPSPSGAAVSG